MKGFLIAAGIVGALYLADQQYAPTQIHPRGWAHAEPDAAFIWSLRPFRLAALSQAGNRLQNSLAGTRLMTPHTFRLASVS